MLSNTWLLSLSLMSTVNGCPNKKSVVNAYSVATGLSKDTSAVSLTKITIALRLGIPVGTQHVMEWRATMIRTFRFLKG